MNLTQPRYQGFLHTPFLWTDTLNGLQQFAIKDTSTFINKKIHDSQRLGSYVEELVFYQLNHHAKVKVLETNKQIIVNKKTLGEIDCLFIKNNTPVHLEIAFKFYLFNPNVGRNFFEHWIGPNKRDSLALKLAKIKEKQFPLLFNKECRPILKKLNFQALEIVQNTYFKAQLFLPYPQEIDLKNINPECVYGFYTTLDAFQDFAESKFYIPKKLDWLIDPHPNISWINYKEATQQILLFFKNQSSPLLWIKHPNGILKKMFVVWW